MSTLNQLKKIGKELTKSELSKVLGGGVVHMTCADGFHITYRNVEVITTDMCSNHGGMASYVWEKDDEVIAPA